MTLILVEYRVTDSWDPPPPTFKAIAENEAAAKKWIQDEVDGKHGTGVRYMQGKSADWWIQYGTFALTPVELQILEEG